MRTNFHRLAASAAILATASAWSTTSASAAGGVKAGFLTCNVASGFGFVFGSSRAVRCVYSAGRGVEEHYAGSITKFGVDIGYLRSAVMLWAVLAPTTTVAPGALAGNYAGVTAGAAVGVGVGGNALVGGSGNQFALQPLSVEGETGLNVAAGVEALHLRPAR